MAVGKKIWTKSQEDVDKKSRRCGQKVKKMWTKSQEDVDKKSRECVDKKSREGWKEKPYATNAIGLGLRV